jgi:hypothetical protein
MAFSPHPTAAIPFPIAVYPDVFRSGGDNPLLHGHRRRLASHDDPSFNRSCRRISRGVVNLLFVTCTPC